MSRPWIAALLALPLTAAHAAEQAQPPACDAQGVCAQPAEAAPATGGKHLWASSRLYTDAPPLDVQKWLTDKPEMEGKFLVIEFWRTWCGACKRTTPLLNALQKKFGDELAVIAITGEAEEKVRAYAGPKLEYFVALDKPCPAGEAGGPTTADPAPSENSAALPDQLPATAKVRPGQGQYEARFDVWGWPHVIVLEPQYRTIVWEGFPGLKGFELTEAKVAKMLAIGRSMKAEEAAKKKQ
jgi:thiol-disulfide isomerase/thioredoxin